MPTSPTKLRLLITGSREWTDRALMQNVIADVTRDVECVERVTLVHGGAAGADTIAGQIAHSLGFAQEVYPAQWKRHGRYLAGRIRNIEMIRTRPDLVLAFFHGGAANAGTRHCATEAVRWGLRVMEVWDV